MKSTRTAAYKRLLELLKRSRKAAGLTQAELARQLKRPQSFVSKSESGERRLDVIEFVEWTQEVGIDPQAVLGEVVGGLSTARRRQIKY